MCRKFSTIIIFSFFALFTSFNLFSQWQPDVRLTNNFGNSYTSFNNGRDIAAVGNILHVTWYDYRDGNSEIYYKRSADAGLSWGGDVRLTNDPNFSWYPHLTASGSVVHIVWYDWRVSGIPKIFYKRSTDGGISWGPDTQLSSGNANSVVPSVIVSGSVVHLVWFDNRDGNYEIYYKRSTDDGLSWGADTRLTNNTGDSQFPSPAVSGSIIHLAWHDNRDGNTEIYYKRSTNGGLNWEADTRLTNNPASSEFSSISASGMNVHVVWEDSRDGSTGIYTINAQPMEVLAGARIHA